MSGLQVVIPDLDEIESGYQDQGAVFNDADERTVTLTSPSSYQGRQPSQDQAHQQKQAGFYGTSVPSSNSATAGFNTINSHAFKRTGSFDDAPTQGAGSGGAPYRPIQPPPLPPLQTGGKGGGPFRGAELWHGRSGSNASSTDLPSPASVGGSSMFRFPPSGSSGAGAIASSSGGKTASQSGGAPRKSSLASLRAAFKSAASSVNVTSSSNSHQEAVPVPALPSNGGTGSTITSRSRPSLDRNEGSGFRSGDPSSSPAKSITHGGSSARYLPYSTYRGGHQRTESPASIVMNTYSPSTSVGTDLSGYYHATNGRTGVSSAFGHVHKKSQLSEGSVGGSSLEGHPSGLPPLPPMPTHLQYSTRTQGIYEDGAGKQVPGLLPRTRHPAQQQAPGPLQAPFEQPRAAPSARPTRRQRSEDESLSLPDGIGIADAQTPAHFGLNVLLIRFLRLARSKVQGILSKPSADLTATGAGIPSGKQQSEDDFRILCRSLGKAGQNDFKAMWTSLFVWRATQISSSSFGGTNAAETSVFEDDETLVSSSPRSQLRSMASSAQQLRLRLATMIVLCETLSLSMEEVNTVALGTSGVSLEQEMLALLNECLSVRLSEGPLFQQAYKRVGDLVEVLSQKR